MLTVDDVLDRKQYETIKHSDLFTQDEIKEITDGHWLFKKLLCEKFIEEDEKHIHINEFQPTGFWHKTHDNIARTSEFHWDLVHLEYMNFKYGTGKEGGYDVVNCKIFNGESQDGFVDFLHSIKSEFNLKEYFHYVKDLMHNNLLRYTDDFGGIFYYALYDLNYVFETHTDGRDVKCKKQPRPDNWDDLKPEDWFQEENVKFTRQGLINLDVADPNDGTVTFNQTFPYSLNIDMSKPLGQMRIEGDSKPCIQFVKGDEPRRFGAEITNFTHKIIDEDEYDEIMEHCFDESVFPIEETYGLSLEKVLTLDKPGTFYSWDCERFHKVKPYPDTIDPMRRRLTIHFSCAEELS